MAFRTGNLLLVVKKLQAVRDISLVGKRELAVSFEVCRLSRDWKLKALLQCKEQRDNTKESVQRFQLADESEDSIWRGQASNGFPAIPHRSLTISAACLRCRRCCWRN